MLSVAILSDDQKNIDIIKNLVQDYIIENQSLIKIFICNNSEELKKSPNSFDLYIMDLDFDEYEVIKNLMLEMMNIDKGSYTLLIGKELEKGYQISEDGADFYLQKDINRKAFRKILEKLQINIKNESIVINTNYGERRIKIDNLNYINIEKRCLCYHLSDGNLLDGQILRTNFATAIEPLLSKKMLYFIPPSLLINLEKIEIMNKECVIFENEEKLYVPKKSSSDLNTAWKYYYII